MRRAGVLSLFICGLAAGCMQIINPVTTTPAAILGAYEATHRRERWLKFSEQGDVYAQFELAESYRKGMMEGDINGAEAMRWYCEAGKNGYAKAQVMLGKLFEQSETIHGLEVEKDNTRAWMWYALAMRRVNEEARMRRPQLEQVMTPQELRDAHYLMQSPKQVPCSPDALDWKEVPKSNGAKKP